MNDSIHLLCVVGMSPAVVTETIWAIAVGADEESRESVGAVSIVTTSVGRDRMAPVLEVELDRMRELYPDLASSFPRYDNVSVHVPLRRDGTEIADVRDSADSASMADEIFAVVRRATSKPVRVHASIAGGRKTMGYHMGNAMQLFARAGDRMSHVLVDAPADSSRDFFFPYPEPGTVMESRRNPFDPAGIAVALQEIPFVRLRDSIETEVLPETHWDLIAAAQADLFGDARLVVDFLELEATYADQPVAMTPTQFALLGFIALEKLAGNTPTSTSELVGGDSSNKLATFADYVCELDDSFLHFVSNRSGDPVKAQRYKKNLRTQLNALRKALNRYFPETVVRAIVPEGDGNGYDIALDPGRIDLIGLEYVERIFDEHL